MALNPFHNGQKPNSLFFTPREKVQEQTVLSMPVLELILARLTSGQNPRDVYLPFPRQILIFLNSIAENNPHPERRHFYKSIIPS